MAKRKDSSGAIAAHMGRFKRHGALAEGGGGGRSGGGSVHDQTIKRCSCVKKHLKVVAVVGE